VACDVNNLADKKQAWDFLAFHRLAGQFVRINATHSYFGFFVALRIDGEQRPFVNLLLCLSERLVAPARRRVRFEPARRKTLGQ
jgi:hypothetical protein